MSLHTISYASHVLGHVDMNRSPYKTRLRPALAIPPSSILLHTDESGRFPESKKGPGSDAPSRSGDSTGSLLGQANTVGIIGGVSVDSTLNFLRKLVKWSKKEGKSSLPFVLHSDTVLNKELLSHDRSSFPSLSKSQSNRLDPTPIVENLRTKRTFLENSGACCIVMPCNILHSWHDEVSKGCSVPFLHMAESVARELKEAKLKPLEAGSRLRIGVLATDATLTAGFYQEKLHNEMLDSVGPQVIHPLGEFLDPGKLLWCTLSVDPKTVSLPYPHQKNLESNPHLVPVVKQKLGKASILLFLGNWLRKLGFEVVLPDKATMEHTVIPAIEALNRKDTEGARNLLRIALQVLLVRAVNSVILASDDMRDLFSQDDPLLKKCIDPMDALARSTIKWAQSAEMASYEHRECDY